MDNVANKIDIKSFKKADNRLYEDIHYKVVGITRFRLQRNMREKVFRLTYVDATVSVRRNLQIEFNGR